MIEMAVFSDVHGNLPALSVVLDDIRRRGIHQLYCLGDLVDFAPWGNEVIDKIRSLGIPCLLGNHDERIAFDLPVIPLLHHSAEETVNRNIAISHSKLNIGEANKSWLAQLPYNLEISFKVNGKMKKVLLVHGSTRSNDEYIYEDHDREDLKNMLLQTEVDVILMGHTHLSYSKHIQMDKEHANLVVNCGSVGRSKEPNHLATYAILRIAEGEPTAEIVRLPYPVADVTEGIYRSGIPDFYANFLLCKT